jgi:hypothetical protein
MNEVVLDASVMLLNILLQSEVCPIYSVIIELILTLDLD